MRLHRQLPHASNARDGARVLYGIRPEHFTLAEGGSSAEVVVAEPTGSETQIALRFAGQPVIAAFRERIPARPGDRLALTPLAARSHVFDALSGQRLN